MSVGIALQNREVFSYLQILFFVFVFSVQVVSTFCLSQYSRQIVLRHYLLGILALVVILRTPSKSSKFLMFLSNGISSKKPERLHLIKKAVIYVYMVVLWI